MKSQSFFSFMSVALVLILAACSNSGGDAAQTEPVPAGGSASPSQVVSASDPAAHPADPTDKMVAFTEEMFIGKTIYVADFSGYASMTFLEDGSFTSSDFIKSGAPEEHLVGTWQVVSGYLYTKPKIDAPFTYYFPYRAHTAEERWSTSVKTTPNAIYVKSLFFNQDTGLQQAIDYFESLQRIQVP